MDTLSHPFVAGKEWASARLTAGNHSEAVCLAVLQIQGPGTSMLGHPSPKGITRSQTESMATWLPSHSPPKSTEKAFHLSPSP